MYHSSAILETRSGRVVLADGPSFSLRPRTNPPKIEAYRSSSYAYIYFHYKSCRERTGVRYFDVICREVCGTSKTTLLLTTHSRLGSFSCKRNSFRKRHETIRPNTWTKLDENRDEISNKSCFLLHPMCSTRVASRSLCSRPGTAIDIVNE